MLSVTYTLRLRDCVTAPYDCLHWLVSTKDFHENELEYQLFIFDRLKRDFILDISVLRVTASAWPCRSLAP